MLNYLDLTIIPWFCKNISSLHSEILEYSNIKATSSRMFSNNDVCVCVSKASKQEISKERENVNVTKY